VRLARARVVTGAGAVVGLPAPDVVVVDCSPALTDAVHAATLPEADPVVVVARLDAAGLPNVAEAVELARALGRPVRVVPTFAAHTGLAREALAFLRGRYGDAVTAAVVPTDARAAEAPGRGRAGARYGAPVEGGGRRAPARRGAARGAAPVRHC
jgi:cellulose biosynthesis protein BcsQ